jgi:F-type H+-transporting ATPase subunit a
MILADAFSHVSDTNTWEFFETLGLVWHIPFGLSKYKILMILAALLIVAIYLPLASRSRNGDAPKGKWWNCWESILTFIRDQLAKPYIGHDADRYVPYLWTTFLFILFCNLFGMFPFGGSPTASFTVTGALALCTFCYIHGAAIYKMGLKHYFQSYLPHLDVPFGMGYVIVPMIAVIEFLGNFIKAFVLAVRLFANMFAGHVVLAFLLFFIVELRHADRLLFWGVTVSSVLGVTALSLLELFVAFLQAYVFTFLTALFLGSTLHPQH